MRRGARRDRPREQRGADRDRARVAGARSTRGPSRRRRCGTRRPRRGTRASAATAARTRATAASHLPTTAARSRHARGQQQLPAAGAPLVGDRAHAEQRQHDELRAPTSAACRRAGPRAARRAAPAGADRTARRPAPANAMPCTTRNSPPTTYTIGARSVTASSRRATQQRADHAAPRSFPMSRTTASSSVSWPLAQLRRRRVGDDRAVDDDRDARRERLEVGDGVARHQRPRDPPPPPRGGRAARGSGSGPCRSSARRARAAAARRAARPRARRAGETPSTARRSAARAPRRAPPRRSRGRPPPRPRRARCP